MRNPVVGGKERKGKGMVSVLSFGLHNGGALISSRKEERIYGGEKVSLLFSDCLV